MRPCYIDTGIDRILIHGSGPGQKVHSLEGDLVEAGWDRGTDNALGEA